LLRSLVRVCPRLLPWLAGVLLFGCTGPDVRLRSKHFYQGSFHNLQPPPAEFGYGDFLAARLGWSSNEPIEMSGWPETVANPPVLPLTPPAAGKTKVTWLIHSSFLIQAPGLTVLTDPLTSPRVSPFSFAGPKLVRRPAIELAKLPHLDLVLISHNHYDHLDVAALQELEARHHPLFLVGLGTRDYLLSKGLTRVQELDWFESVAIGPLQVDFVPAQHFSARWPWDKDQQLWGGFWLQQGEKSLYFVGDSAQGRHFSLIRERYGRPEVMLIPIGAYEPQWFMKVMHLNPVEAVEVHQTMGATVSIAMHRESVQLSNESIDAPVEVLNRTLQQRGLPQSQFLAPPIGGSYEF